MATVTESVEIQAPVEVVYAEWTDLTKLPNILTFVDEVHVLDETRSHWKISIAGNEHEYDAETINVVPNTQIAWRSVVGDVMDGAVNFEPMEEGGTKLTLTMNWEPEGVVESVGSAMNIDSMAVASDLRNFRDRIEERYTQTPA